MNRQQHPALGRRAMLAGMGALAAGHAGAAPAEPPRARRPAGDSLADALRAIDQQRLEDARRAIGAIADPLAQRIARWALYQGRRAAGFEELAQFLARHSDWPAATALARRAEEALEGAPVDDASVRAFFRSRAPLTGQGAARLAEVHVAAGNAAEARRVVRTAWRGAAMSFETELDFLGRFQSQLEPADHAERADRLLWEGRAEEAQRALSLLPEAARGTLQARAWLAQRYSHAEAAAQAASARDPGLGFEYARFLRRAGRDVEAARVLAAAPAAPAERLAAIAVERQALARRLVELGYGADAYTLMAAHGLTTGARFVDAEFLTGWIALRVLNDPRRAVPHFVQLAESARLPVSQSRGAYWAGRAGEAAGDRAAARSWYARAARFPVAFYGQLAAARIDARAAWPAEPARDAGFVQRHELARAARMLAEIGQDLRARQFVTQCADGAASAGQVAALADAMSAAGRPDLAVVAAKRAAAGHDVMLPRAGWPTVTLGDTAGLEPALALAIIRQESELNPRAVSPAGARGLMQLMPATARNVAAGLGVRGHTEGRLTADPAYNVRLGCAYLAQRIEEFGGSYVLAICAYNAGPGRVRAWMQQNGDPRDPSVDTLDWIERVPFEETRNYVQRVFENIAVYRWRLGRDAGADAIERDLRRGAPA